MVKKIPVGVIGVGYLGLRHAQTYKQLPQAELVAISDIDEHRLKEASSTLNVNSISQYRTLFSKVKAVSIATPTITHYEIAKDCLRHGIDVLIEKPITTGLVDAASLIKLAQKNKLILQVGHVERFNSAFLAVSKIAKHPRFIECHRLSPFPGRSLDIGVVEDLMIHDIDIILGLVKSEIKEISAVGVNVLTPFEDIANARLVFKDGCVCNLTASRISDEPMRKFRIFLEDTYISLDYKNQAADVYKKIGGKIHKTQLPVEKDQHPLKRELHSFLDCVASRQCPTVSGIEAFKALSVALKIKEKIRRNIEKSGRK
ncbi:MAG: Gfo/Idh/MocA family oxidoreductase [Candidatus Omnitrophota bacterium]